MYCKFVLQIGHLFLLIYDIDLLTVKEFNGLPGKVSAVILFKGNFRVKFTKTEKMESKISTCKSKT